MATIGTSDIKNEEEIGLASNHAYGIIKCIEYEGTKLVLIKNPWGKFIWKGKYSNSSSSWNTKLKEACHFEITTKLDGVFWMEFESVI